MMAELGENAHVYSLLPQKTIVIFCFILGKEKLDDLVTKSYFYLVNFKKSIYSILGEKGHFYLYYGPWLE